MPRMSENKSPMLHHDYDVAVRVWAGDQFNDGDERPDKIYDVQSWPVTKALPEEEFSEYASPGIYIKFETHDPVNYFYEVFLTEDDLIGMLNEVLTVKKNHHIDTLYEFVGE